MYQILDKLRRSDYYIGMEVNEMKIKRDASYVCWHIPSKYFIWFWRNRYVVFAITAYEGWTKSGFEKVGINLFGIFIGFIL
jgi:hypothetical protein